MSNNHKSITIALVLGLLVFGLTAYGVYSELQPSTEPTKESEIIIPSTGVDQQLAREIALRIGRSYSTDNRATVETLSQSALQNFDQAQSLLGAPSDQVWQVVLNGNFAIHEGSRRIKAIHATKMYVVIRMSDGQVLAVGTVGPVTMEMDQSLPPPK